MKFVRTDLDLDKQRNSSTEPISTSTERDTRIRLKRFIRQDPVRLTGGNYYAYVEKSQRGSSRKTILTITIQPFLAYLIRKVLISSILSCSSSGGWRLPTTMFIHSMFFSMRATTAGHSDAL